MEFDLDGDKVFEQRLSMKSGAGPGPSLSGDQYRFHEVRRFCRSRIESLRCHVEECRESGRSGKSKKLNTKWYALMLQPKSTRERYHYGFWLQFYLYNDLKDLAGRTNDKALASVIDKAYLQGKWELIK